MVSEVRQTPIRGFGELIDPIATTRGGAPEALRMAAELAEENNRLLDSHQALLTISESSGDLTLTSPAKALDVKPKILISWLSANNEVMPGNGNCGSSFTSGN